MSTTDTIVLSGNITFATVRSQREAFFKRFHKAAGNIVVDLSGIKKLDSAGLALLVEATQTARQLEKKIHYCHMPALYKKLVTFYDLDEIIYDF